MERFDILSPERQAAFLAELAFESQETTVLVENLSYATPERLMRVWPKRFMTPELASPYVRNPEGLANFIYARRGGNGDMASGDGYRYRGRGLLLLRGKDNYRMAGEALDLPLLDNPDMVALPRYAVMVAAFQWNKLGLNELADRHPGDDEEKDFEKIGIALSGRVIGEQIRERYWHEARYVLGAM